MILVRPCRPSSIRRCSLWSGEDRTIVMFSQREIVDLEHGRRFDGLRESRWPNSIQQSHSSWLSGPITKCLGIPYYPLPIGWHIWQDKNTSVQPSCGGYISDNWLRGVGTRKPVKYVLEIAAQQNQLTGLVPSYSGAALGRNQTLCVEIVLEDLPPRRWRRRCGRGVSVSGVGVFNSYCHLYRGQQQPFYFVSVCLVFLQKFLCLLLCLYQRSSSLWCTKKSQLGRQNPRRQYRSELFHSWMGWRNRLCEQVPSRRTRFITWGYR